PQLHQVDEVGASSEKRGTGSGRGPHGLVHGFSARIVKWLQRPSSAASSPNAATMFTYAPQRQRLPLIRSRISLPSSFTRSAIRSSLTDEGIPARASVSIPTAEQIWPGVQYPH